MEKLKLRYQIARDKLAFYSAGVGGTFLLLMTKKLPIIGEAICIIGFILSLIGMLVNLVAIAKISKEIENE